METKSFEKGFPMMTHGVFRIWTKRVGQCGRRLSLPHTANLTPPLLHESERTQSTAHNVQDGAIPSELTALRSAPVGNSTAVAHCPIQP